MPYCQKCGEKTEGDMAFCPKCGAPLKGKQAAEAKPVTATYRRNEKAEKHEKDEKMEKREKEEKHEKQEYGFAAPLIGGVIIIVLGMALYLETTGIVKKELLWASFLVVAGVLIILGGIYAMSTASRRHPKP